MKKIILRILATTIIFSMTILCIYCYINTKPISNKSEEVVFKIKEGSSMKDISLILKKEGLIRSDKFFLIYTKVHNIRDIKAGNYEINKTNSLKKIVKILRKGSNAKNEVTITFPEGKTMRKVAKIIEDNTTNSYDDVFNLLKDKEYLNEIINKYWFLDSIILDENIYYPLEGYLAPDTYIFETNATVKDIFEKMLDQTDVILTKNKDNIDKGNYTVHQIITLASMVESEGVNLADRKKIAGVFINRLTNSMSLGSDVTTYYAQKIELGERDLYLSEITDDNPYNTRSTANIGKLPVGPICNPSSEAIDAVINYTPSDNLFFVADKNMKVYFSKTESEHNKIVKELKEKGLWFEY